MTNILCKYEEVYLYHSVREKSFPDQHGLYSVDVSLPVVKEIIMSIAQAYLNGVFME